MAEVKNFRKYAGWYASYMNSNQGEALIEVLEMKIKQLEDVIENVVGELELDENPKLIIDSATHLLTNIPKIEHTKGYFTWNEKL